MIRRLVAASSEGGGDADVLSDRRQSEVLSVSGTVTKPWALVVAVPDCSGKPPHAFVQFTAVCGAGRNCCALRTVTSTVCVPCSDVSEMPNAFAVSLIWVPAPRL